MTAFASYSNHVYAYVYIYIYKLWKYHIVYVDGLGAASYPWSRAMLADVRSHGTIPGSIFLQLISFLLFTPNEELSIDRTLKLIVQLDGSRVRKRQKTNLINGCNLVLGVDPLDVTVNQSVRHHSTRLNSRQKKTEKSFTQ